MAEDDCNKDEDELEQDDEGVKDEAEEGCDEVDDKVEATVVVVFEYWRAVTTVSHCLLSAV